MTILRSYCMHSAEAAIGVLQADVCEAAVFHGFSKEFAWAQDLVDVHIFAEAHAILEALARRNCTAALQWCGQHRSRLRKIRSKLEFMLRIQARCFTSATALRLVVFYL